MSDCDLIRVHLAARAAGEELEETQELVGRHLERCRACREEASRLERTAGLLADGTLAEARAPGEDAVDWDRFRAETLHRALRPARPWWRQPAAVAAAAAALTVAVLVPLAVLRTPPDHGRPALAEGPPRPPADEAPLSGADADSFLRDLEVVRSREQAARLLRGGRNLLVQLAGAPAYCERERRDMAAERDASLRLLRQKEVLDPHLVRLDLGRSRGVCDDLERVLRSVAVLEDCPEPADVRVILEVATSRGLLPRIDAALQGLGEGGGSRV